MGELCKNGKYILEVISIGLLFVKTRKHGHACTRYVCHRSNFSLVRDEAWMRDKSNASMGLFLE
jgi:hypothetical protein